MVKKTEKNSRFLGQFPWEFTELEDKFDGIDPYQWAKEYVENLNREETADQIEVIAKFSNSKRILKGNQVRYNGGYLFLQSLYNEMGLDRICKNITSRYKFEFDLNSILSALIYTRILYPSSKRSSLESSGRFLEPPRFELQHIYRALEILAKESDFIQSELYKASCKSVKRNTKVLYYDCTNYFFEIEQASGIKQFGISKENRPNPIVQMGLFMDGDGLPLTFCLNPGNKNEQQTLTPLETKVIKDFELSKFIVCTDAGLASKNNRMFNACGERAYVVTQSLKIMKAYLKEWALAPDGWHLPESNKIFNLETIDDTSENKNVYYKSRMINEGGLEEQLIVTYSPKYKQYMRKIRDGQIMRAESKLKSPSLMKKKRSDDPKRFVTSYHCTKEGEIAEKEVFAIDAGVIANEQKFDGFYGVCTYLEAEPLDIIKINKGRWEIEQSFRIMKSEFRARPVFLSRNEHILLTS